MQKITIDNMLKTLRFWAIIEEKGEFMGFDDLEITSLHRDKYTNDRIGGSKTSQHLKGKAIDIKTKHTWALLKLIESLIKTGILPEGGLGIYDTHVHYDWRGTKTRWNNVTP